MSISEPFIRRPVATTLLMIGLLLAGLVGFRAAPGLGAAAGRLPDHRRLDVPARARAPRRWRRRSRRRSSGSSGRCRRSTQMTSVSSFGSSQITLQFTLDRNIDAAEQDVQAAINAASNLLPRTLPRRRPTQEQPRRHADPDARASARTSLPLDQVDDYADSILAQKISQVSGVGLVTLNGGAEAGGARAGRPGGARRRAGSTLEDVRTALVAANVNQPKGNIDGAAAGLRARDERPALQGRRRSSRSSSRTRTARRCASRDVANVVDGVENAQLAGWAERQARDHPQRAAPAGRQRHPGRRPREGAAAAARRRRSRRASTSTILSDRTETVRASVEDVEFTLVLTIGLVVAVIFVFLRNVRATIIPSVAVPLSLDRHVRRDVPAAATA